MSDVRNLIRSGNRDYMTSRYLSLAQIVSALEDAVRECRTTNKRFSPNTLVKHLEKIEPARVRDEELFPFQPANMAFLSKRVTRLEPMIRDSRIGRDYYHCGKCWGYVDLVDGYCRKCGRKLIAEDEENDAD